MAALQTCGADACDLSPNITARADALTSTVAGQVSCRHGPSSLDTRCACS
jgi:hypothetical protein